MRQAATPKQIVRTIAVASRKVDRNWLTPARLNATSGRERPCHTDSENGDVLTYPRVFHISHTGPKALTIPIVMGMSATMLHRAGELEERPAMSIRAPTPTRNAEMAYATTFSIVRSTSNTGSIAPLGLQAKAKRSYVPCGLVSSLPRNRINSSVGCWRCSCLELCESERSSLRFVIRLFIAWCNRNQAPPPAAPALHPKAPTAAGADPPSFAAAKSARGLSRNSLAEYFTHAERRQ